MIFGPHSNAFVILFASRAYVFATTDVIIVSVLTLFHSIAQMGNNQSDVVTLLAPQQLAAKRSHLSLRPVVLEKFKDHYLVVVHKDVSEEALKKSPM